MWIARNNILDKDIKIFTHKPTRNTNGYWEDLKVINYDENRRYGFIISIDDIVGDHTITWEDEPKEITINVPIKENKSEHMSDEQFKRYWGIGGGYPAMYMRDSWYGD